MTRLNKDLRTAIINNAVKASGLEYALNHNINYVAEIAEDVRQLLLKREGLTDPDIYAKIQQVYALSDNFISAWAATYQGINFKINISGYHFLLGLDGSGNDTERTPLTAKIRKEQRELKTCRFLPHTKRPDLADDDLRDKLVALFEERKRINKKADELVSQVNATVNRFNTVAQLLKAWPEAKDLLPADEPVQSTAVALDVKTLNSICGLPK